MSRLEKVIEEVKAVRTMQNHAWIYDDNGNISDDVICGDILPLLDELREYEISVTDKWIENFLEQCDEKGNFVNTYNHNANVSNDILYAYNDKNGVMVFAIHLYGDARWNYSEYFAVKFDSIYDFYELESLYQSIEINDRYIASVNLLCECYNVWDYVNDEEVGEFYEIEKTELLEELKNR